MLLSHNQYGNHHAHKQHPPGGPRIPSQPPRIIFTTQEQKMIRRNMSPPQKPVLYTASPDPRVKRFLQDWEDFEDSDDDTLERFLATFPDGIPKLPESFHHSSTQNMKHSASQVSGNAHRPVLRETGLNIRPQSNVKNVMERTLGDMKEGCGQTKKRRRVDGAGYGGG